MFCLLLNDLSSVLIPWNFLLFPFYDPDLRSDLLIQHLLQQQQPAHGSSAFISLPPPRFRLLQTHRHKQPQTMGWSRRDSTAPSWTPTERFPQQLVHIWTSMLTYLILCYLLCMLATWITANDLLRLHRCTLMMPSTIHTLNQTETAEELWVILVHISDPCLPPSVSNTLERDPDMFQ